MAGAGICAAAGAGEIGKAVKKRHKNEWVSGILTHSKKVRSKF